MSLVCIYAVTVTFTNYRCPIAETDNKSANLNAPVNGVMAHRKQQKW